MKPKPIVRFFPLIILIGLVFGCISLISSIFSTARKQNAREEREQILMELTKREQELQKKLEYAQTPEFIEAEARTKLNMARPNETIILIDQKADGENFIQTPMEHAANWKKWWELFY